MSAQKSPFPTRILSLSSTLHVRLKPFNAIIGAAHAQFCATCWLSRRGFLG